MIQAVSFLSPMWRSPTTFEGVTFSPSPKNGTKNCQVPINFLQHQFAWWFYELAHWRWCTTNQAETPSLLEKNDARERYERWLFNKKIFYFFTPILGEMIQVDSYFSDGLNETQQLGRVCFWRVSLHNRISGWMKPVAETGRTCCWGVGRCYSQEAK